jgi:hypothetical protein
LKRAERTGNAGDTLLSQRSFLFRTDCLSG